MQTSQECWKGREGGMHEKVRLVNIEYDPLPNNGFAFVSFCCDEGVRRNQGRVGTKLGPNELKGALSNICIDTDLPIIDCGNIYCNDYDLEAAQKSLSHIVSKLISHNIHPIILGGGHEVAFGSFQGIKQAHPNEKCGIINFDAHLDLRDTLDDNKGSSGTPFWQIAQLEKENFNYACLGIQRSGNSEKLLTRAKELKVETVDAEIFHTIGSELGEEAISKIIDTSNKLYLTVCMDVFASPYAPGVSAPQPLGLLPWHVIPLLRKIARSGKVAAFDIAELSPPYDIDKRTAKLGANLIAEFIHTFQS